MRLGLGDRINSMMKDGKNHACPSLCGAYASVSKYKYIITTTAATEIDNFTITCANHKLTGILICRKDRAHIYISKSLVVAFSLHTYNNEDACDILKHSSTWRKYCNIVGYIPITTIPIITQDSHNQQKLGVKRQ